MTGPEKSPDDARIRGLLAEARHTEPMPPEVADRLDSVIADLAAERHAAPVVPAMAPVAPDPTPDAEVVALPSPWRRRITTGLVAAAAVVAVGVGVPQLLSSSDYMSGSESAGGEAGSEAALEAPADSADSARSGFGREELDGSFPSTAKQSVEKDYKDIDFVLATSGEAASEDAPALLDQRDHDRGELPCWRKAWGAGDRAPVLYEDRPGVAVMRLAGVAGTRVDFYVCGEKSKVRSVLVPDE